MYFFTVIKKMTRLNRILASGFLFFIATNIAAQDKQLTLIGGGFEQPSIINARLFFDLKSKQVIIFDVTDNEIFTYNIQNSETSYIESGSLQLDFEQNQFHSLTSFTRNNISSGTLNFVDKHKKIEVEALKNQDLIRALFIGNRGEKYYILQEEFNNQQDSIEIRRYVLTYSSNDTLLMRTEFSSNSVEFIEDPYLTIDKAGTNIIHLSIENENVVTMHTPLHEGTIDTEMNMTKFQKFASESSEGFEDAVMALVDKNTESDLLPPSITTRKGIINRANKFLDKNWKVKQSNYISNSYRNLCKKPTNLWKRPKHIEGKNGVTVNGLPYKWGGYMSVDTFMDKLKAGSLTGDVCTCRTKSLNYCIIPEAIGVDCSGFVSQVWGINYHTTRSLYKVSDRIKLNELKPGDILVKPGSHVRLYVGKGYDPIAEFLVIESAVSCGGICKRSLSKQRFNGYQARRLKHLK